MKLLSYNIRYLNQSDGEDVWPNRSEKVLATIRDFDIVGLQEVVLEQFETIQAGTGEMAWYGVGRDDGDQRGEMVPIGWRKEFFEPLKSGTFWLSETPQKVGSVGWDAALPRIATWVQLRDKRTADSFLVVNTHFDHRGAQARERSAELIADWLVSERGDRAAIVMGDLNSVAKSAPLQQLIGKSQGVAGLRNARDESPTADPGPSGTWNGFREVEAGRRIDFLLVAGGVQVIAFETLNPKTSANRFASDHLPVSATIRLTPAP